ncbi:hypothetical protein GQ42DRAFT_181275 [Ramicandelaber brevisporus]|nr:hypothetical protein GQ42DRAFT_181275 [Ramicandelaber brevisporus]
MFAFKKLAKTISQPVVEGISLVPLGTTDNGSIYSPSAFIDGRLGITPSKVTGEVVLRYPEEEIARVKRVEVILRGQCDTVWTEEVAGGKKVLWQAATSGGHAGMTNKRFPFSIELPGDVPSTMKTENVEVKYTLEALVTIARKYNEEKKRLCKILPVLNYGSSLAMITSVPGHIGDPVQLSLPPEYAKQGFSWKCTLDSGSIVYSHEPHVALTIPAEFKYAKVKNVFLALKEHVVINDDKAYTGSISRWVNIRHLLELQVSLSGTKDINISVPVIITPLARADIGRLKKERQAQADRVTASTIAATTTTTATATTTTTTTTYPGDNDYAPPAYESGDWIPSPPATETETSSAPPAYFK